MTQPEKLPHLDARLSALAEMAVPGIPAADIGTDHAYLIVWLACTGKIPYGYACDINPLPLKRAQETICKYHAEEKVTTLLSDGLQALEPAQAGQIFIAGMGGELIAKILGDVPWSQTSACRFLLQPMTKAEHLRAWLWENGFEIGEEQAVQSGKFCYPILAVSYAGKPSQPSPLLLQAGKIGEPGWKGDMQAARAYLLLQKKRVNARIEGLSASCPQHPELSRLYLLREQLSERLLSLPKFT